MKVRAVVALRFMVPKVLPPQIRAIAAGVEFAASDLPEADVRAMLRQGTLVAVDPAPVVAAAPDSPLIDESQPVA